MGKNPLIVSCGWDKLIKVWNLNNCKLKTNLAGHSGVLYTITVSPDGSLCGSGGKDGTAMCFSPKNYWLCAATDTSIKIWDLENKNVLDELTTKTIPKSGIPWCVSLQWSADGNTLFAGSTDGHIYVYQIGRS